MERSELMSSAASGSYGLTQTENDDTLSEGCSENTLNLVEGAILRTLKKHSSHVPEQESKRAGGTRLRGRFNNAADEEQESAISERTPPAKSSNPEDMELLANLLEQVHDLRRNQRQGSRKPKETPPHEAQDILKPARRRGREKKSYSSSEELRMTLEAATMAAKAAADAAEAAAVSVARNTEAIEFIVNSMKSSKKRRKSKSVAASDEKKAIVKSNQRTHWILGFMAITTIAWRFGVAKVAKRISSKLNDPLGYVGGLIGNNEDSSNEKPVEKPAEKGNLLDKLPHIDVPEFLPNVSDHKTNGKEKKVKETKQTKETKGKETSFFSKSAAAVDVKTKEVEKTAFSFARFLQIKPKET
ncbi:hypothetical protein M758_3G132700 [Ceratodon purpureus]|nr:hypothetical protein M758_3G132700 [Ceratodon purpureus]